MRDNFFTYLAGTEIHIFKGEYPCLMKKSNFGFTNQLVIIEN